MTRLTPDQIGEIEKTHRFDESLCVKSFDELLALARERHNHRAALLAHIRTLEKAGWKLVPREPTAAMIEASDNAVLSGSMELSSAELRWQAMYDAAPPSPEPTPGQEG